MFIFMGNTEVFNSKNILFFHLGHLPKKIPNLCILSFYLMRHSELTVSSIEMNNIR